MTHKPKVKKVTPFWHDVRIYGKTYLGGNVEMILPCGHLLRFTIGDSCTYVLDGDDPEQQEYHTETEIADALEEGCRECGAMFRPLSEIAQEIHSRLMREAEKAGRAE